VWGSIRVWHTTSKACESSCFSNLCQSGLTGCACGSCTRARCRRACWLRQLGMLAAAERLACVTCVRAAASHSSLLSTLHPRAPGRSWLWINVQHHPEAGTSGRGALLGVDHRRRRCLPALPLLPGSGCSALQVGRDGSLPRAASLLPGWGWKNCLFFCSRSSCPRPRHPYSGPKGCTLCNKNSHPMS